MLIFMKIGLFCLVNPAFVPPALMGVIAVPITCQDENGNDVSSFRTTYNCSVNYVAL